MSSYTINIMGFGKGWQETENGETVTKRREYPAHTKLAMAQAVKKAQEAGDEIVGWYAQTGAGCRMLTHQFLAGRYPGESYTPVMFEEVAATLVMLPTTIPCPACTGNGCGICDHSGIVTKQHLRNYQPWQLEPRRVA